MQYNQLIIGQGLAGSLLAFELIGRGQHVLVLDEEENHTSSRIAAGMFTPMSGKRMAKSWMADELYPVMIATYRQLEQDLGIRVLSEKHVQLSFSSIKEQNDFYSSLNERVNKYVIPDVTPHPGLKAPYGCAEINQSGWVNTSVLLPALKRWLTERKAFRSDRFTHNLLKREGEMWHYKDVSAAQVIFCEGYKNKGNPYFGHLPVLESKGDVFLLRTEVLNSEKIYKRGAYALSVGNGLFKCGSTYKWDETDPTPDQAGYDELKARADDLINGPYEVTEHLAGIRPASKDRRPILGQHPDAKGLFVFNGLGTKGVMLAPYFAKVMTRFVVDGQEPDAEVNASRFKKR